MASLTITQKNSVEPQAELLQENDYLPKREAANKGNYLEYADGKLLSHITIMDSAGKAPVDMEDGFFELKSINDPGTKLDVSFLFHDGTPVMDVGLRTTVVLDYLVSGLVRQNNNQRLKSGKDFKVNGTVKILLNDAVRDFQKHRSDVINMLSTEIKKLTGLYVRINKGGRERTVNIAMSHELPTIDDKRRKTNHEFEFTFSPEFLSLLRFDFILTFLPQEYYAINQKKHPHAQHLLKRLYRHARMNQGKPNEGKISVEYLIKAASFKTPQEVLDSNNKSYSRQVIVPFLRDMEALKDFVTVKYYRDGKQIKEENLIGIPTKAFTRFWNAEVRFKWKKPLPIDTLEIRSKHSLEPPKKQQN